MATRTTIYYKQKVGKKEEAHKLNSVHPVSGISQVELGLFLEEQLFPFLPTVRGDE